MAGRYIRTIDESRVVISHAKIDENDLKPITQPLYFSDKVDEFEKYKFIEIDPSLLNVLQEGENRQYNDISCSLLWARQPPTAPRRLSSSLRARGPCFLSAWLSAGVDPTAADHASWAPQLVSALSPLLKFCGLKDENAVLCTRNKTYEVKEAETSNSLLLLSSLKWSDKVDEADSRILEEREVCGIFHKYLELRPCLPQLHKLHSLLNEHPYLGPENEDEVNQTTGYSFEELLARVQASEEELQLALTEETACCISGKWRKLDPKYQLRVLSLILGVVEENSWSFGAVVKDEVCQALCELVPTEILLQCFSWYTEPVGEVDSNGAALYRVNEAKVCRFMGEMILATVEGLTLENFLTAWQNSVPEGMVLQTSYMDGLMLVKKINDKEIVQYFPESNLPINISERFAVLFETREKWTYDEIYPYIARFASGNMNVGALLTKYARTSKNNGVKCYTSKHGR